MLVPTTLRKQKFAEMKGKEGIGFADRTLDHTLLVLLQTDILMWSIKLPYEPDKRQFPYNPVCHRDGETFFRCSIPQFKIIFTT